MAEISVWEFSFRYRREQRPILSDINLDFSTEERILILGPSGGGKSTLLTALLRLYTAYDIYYAEGQITYGGKPAEDLSRRELLELFGVVFQSPAHQFCLSTPMAEAAFGLENLQIEPRLMQGIIDESFSRFGFSKTDHRIQELSGGEQQLLAAASTTLLGSRMLVMDEPTAHLDPSGRREIRSSLDSWLEEPGKERGLLLVEHHIDLWLDLVQRIVVLDKQGRILFDERGTELLSREKNLLSEMGIWLPRQTVFKAASVQQPGPSPSTGRVSSKAPVLSLTDAHLGYGKKPVVRGVNLQVRRGELVALAGRNGCGKSTLLQSLVGLSDLQSGTIDRAESPTMPAYIFQNPEHQFIYPTVEEEMQLVSGGEREKLLGKYGLWEKRKQNPHTLSGGEKRRLSLAAMLAQQHELYLLDEPTFGQDARTAGEIVRAVEDLHNRGAAIIMVSHDLPLFTKILSRIVVMNRGDIVFDGSPRDLGALGSALRRQWGVEI